MGPHPAVAEIRRAVRSGLAPRGGVVRLDGQDRVVVACSGGADSLALAAAVAFEAPRAGLAAGLVTVDHGLQPGSAQRAAQVAALGYELGLDPVLTLPVSVGTAGGREAAARTARYAALQDTADSLGARVLLGHTLDDQAETVLLGLGRGSGPRSIAGMRAVSGGPPGNERGGPPADEGVAGGGVAAGGGRYLRPLLGVRRAVTAAACAALGLPVWDDPHNTDPSFRRVRLRREVLPLLEDVLAGGVAEALARTATLLRDDLDALDAVAEQAVRRLTMISGLAPESRGSGRDHPQGGRLDARELDVAALVELPRAIRTRALRAWAAECGAAALSAEHTAALDALITGWHGQGPLCLPGGLRVSRASGKLSAHRPSPGQE